MQKKLIIYLPQLEFVIEKEYSPKVVFFIELLPSASILAILTEFEQRGSVKQYLLKVSSCAQNRVAEGVASFRFRNGSSSDE